jgi:hypothetical protein
LSVTVKKNVGDKAFSSARSRLTSITITEGVRSIGQEAFYDCTGLTSITIPASVTSIGNSAFQMAQPSSSSLITVTFAAGSQLQTIGRSAFVNCDRLTGITIPASVTSIGDYAFDTCTSLTDITIPASVKTMGRAFTGWTSSQTMYVRGYASQAAADNAWGGSYWRGSYNATIKYWNGSSYQ